jgi:hypothetical protein
MAEPEEIAAVIRTTLAAGPRTITP